MSRSLIKRSAQALLLLFCLLAAGCLKMEHDLRIKEDGTASYALKYSISEQAISQIRAMNKLKADLAKASGEPDPGPEMDPLFQLFLDPDDGAIREAIHAYEENGITLEELEIDTRSAWRNVELKIEVEDLAKAGETEFFKNHGFDLSQNKDGRYVLSRDPHINIFGQIGAVPTDEELKQLIPIVAGFNTTVKITTPGRIFATTAFRTSLRTASWAFDFDKDPGALQSVQRQPFRIVFESKKTALPKLSYHGSKIKQ